MPVRALNSRRSWVNDLALPTLLFAALGGMTWAVRGCSGYGAANGCLFAGVTWGAAWWFLARDPDGPQSRRYASGWIVLALAFGIGMSGARGWMQWSSFFDSQLQIDAPNGKFVPIDRVYGFVWLFIAGVPWAGIGACMLAWCGSRYRAGWGTWAGRIAFAVAGIIIARTLFRSLPDVFLPLYKTLQAQYLDAMTHPKTTAFPNLRRLYGDNLLAITHLGLYLGLLAYEIVRRDWKNVVLIVTVGFVNGCGWALCQNWKWAPHVWPGYHFNWWRCWESSGGISIGIAYGLAYFLVNRRDSEADRAERFARARPNLERFGLYLGLWLGLGLSIRNGLKGWANIYLGNEDYWSGVLWRVIGPLMLVALAALVIWVYTLRLPRGYRGDVFPNAYKAIWLVLIVQNVLAQLVTGPHTSWDECVFGIYYLLLFFVSAVIVHHVHCVKKLSCIEAVP